MPNYSKGKIYKIVNSENDKLYIGSTVRPLCQRMGGHRNDARKERTTPLYTEMQKLGIGRFKIVLIELYPCNSKIELEKREFHIIQRFIRLGDELLNSTIEYGKHSAEAKIKIGIAGKGKVGVASRAFKRGCLFRNERLERRSPIWTFIWKENGKPRSKSFSVSKYGEKRAKRLAEKVQNEIYPLKTSK